MEESDGRGCTTDESGSEITWKEADRMAEEVQLAAKKRLGFVDQIKLAKVVKSGEAMSKKMK